MTGLLEDQHSHKDLLNNLLSSVFEAKQLLNTDHYEEDEGRFLSPQERQRVLQREIVEWVIKLNQRELSVRPSTQSKQVKTKPSDNSSGFSGILTQRECAMPLGENSLSTIRKSAVASSQRKVEATSPIMKKWQTVGLGSMEEMYLQIIHIQAA
jgi:hypothetical protein